MKDELQTAAQQALEALEEFCEYQTMVRPIEKRNALRAALAEPTVKEFLPVHFLTDEQISDLWHQSGEQPFKFARMLLR